jgi:hypothetical protein
LALADKSRRRELEEKLNSPDYLPARAHRRNHRMYELVCYVNCLLGCRISGNTDGEAVFRDRVEKFLAENPAEEGYGAYYNIIGEYTSS